MTLEEQVKMLREALENMTPAEGFPDCTDKCKAQVFSYDEEPCCSCGFDEIRHYAKQARAALAVTAEPATPVPGFCRHLVSTNITCSACAAEPATPTYSADDLRKVADVALSESAFLACHPSGPEGEDGYNLYSIAQAIEALDLDAIIAKAVRR